MRAVNLIPAEERRGAGGAGGRSGGAAHVLLGVLAVMAVIVSFWTLEKRSVADKRNEVVQLEAQAAAAETEAATLASYTQFAGLRARRVQTVSSLAASRFDWSHALRELARVIPPSTWLTGLQGTVAPGIPLKAGVSATTGQTRSALPVPAIEIVGCTTDQKAVARMMSRMRLIDGVIRVSLRSSAKAEQSGSDGDCRGGRAASPEFALVVFFDSAAGAVPTAAVASTPVPAAQTTPGGPTGPTGPTGATP